MSDNTQNNTKKCADAEASSECIVMCVNHPQNIATHLKDSYFVNKPPYPICDVCVEKLKKKYHTVYQNMNVRSIDTYFN